MDQDDLHRRFTNSLNLSSSPTSGSTFNSEGTLNSERTSSLSNIPGGVSLYGESDNADTALSMSMEMSLADAIKAIRAAQRDSLAYGYPTSLLDLLDLTEEIVVMALGATSHKETCRGIAQQVMALVLTLYSRGMEMVPASTRSIISTFLSEWETVRNTFGAHRQIAPFRRLLHRDRITAQLRMNKLSLDDCHDKLREMIEFDRALKNRPLPKPSASILSSTSTTIQGSSTDSFTPYKVKSKSPEFDTQGIRVIGWDDLEWTRSAKCESGKWYAAEVGNATLLLKLYMEKDGTKEDFDGDLIYFKKQKSPDGFNVLFGYSKRGCEIPFLVFFLDRYKSILDNLGEYRPKYEGNANPLDPSYISELKNWGTQVDLAEQIKRLNLEAESNTTSLWKGFDPNGRYGNVAVKVFRKITLNKDLEKEALLNHFYIDFLQDLRSKMESTQMHFNISKIIGFGQEDDGILLFSSWEINGNVGEYLKDHGSADRHSLLSDIASGLVFLHEQKPPLTHANLKGTNVLISEDIRALLTDYHVSDVIASDASRRKTSLMDVNSARFCSPEVLYRKKAIPSSDVWAFGMIAAEICSSKPPFASLKSLKEVVQAIEQGRHPPAAEHPEAQSVWSLLEECWSMEPSERPTMVRVLRDLSAHVSEALAQFETHDLTQRVRRIGSGPLGSGGFGEIWMGEMDTEDGAVQVVIKDLKSNRRFQEDINTYVIRVSKHLVRELGIGLNMDHKNVIRLFGYTLDNTGENSSLIMPFYANGDAVAFIQDGTADRPRLILGVAEGLCYLHTRNPPIVHADLKGSNVLVDDSGEAIITDFGTSWQVSLSEQMYHTENIGRGTLRYSAPEVLSHRERCTQPGDIYSFGSLALELATSKIPFWTIQEDYRVIAMIIGGDKPDKADYAEAEDGLWRILDACWSFEKFNRPSSEQLVRMLRELYDFPVLDPG